MKISKCLVRLTGMVLLGLGLAGCQTTTEPVTGRSQFILTSPGEEMQLGFTAWEEVVKTEKPCKDAAKVEAVERVGRAISRAVNDPSFQWEFRTFESDQANAFCLPGGKVAVYSGLFKYMANDAELAAVVGHEIAHATARHGGERMTQGMVQQVGAAGLALLLGNRAEQEQKRWMAAYAGLTSVGVLLPFSRKHEYAADQIGSVYMARAGYDPQAAVQFWEKFAAGNKDKGISDFLSTHPADSKRIANLQQLMPKARVEYEMAPGKQGFGRTYTVSAAKR